MRKHDQEIQPISQQYCLHCAVRCTDTKEAHFPPMPQELSVCRPHPDEDAAVQSLKYPKHSQVSGAVCLEHASVYTQLCLHELWSILSELYKNKPDLGGLRL